MPEETQTTECKIPEGALMATIHADAALIKVLIAESEVARTRPNQAGEANRKVLRAIEICLSAHRRGGCTSANLNDMAKVEIEIRRMA